MTHIRHVHSSSRWDRSPASLLVAARRYNRMADLVTYTEVEHESRRQAIRDANGNTWGFISGDGLYANDCAISYRKTRMNLLFSENYKSTNTPFFLKWGKKKHPQWATNAVFRDISNGRVFVVTVIHLASWVERFMAGGKSTKPTESWYDSFRGSKARTNALAKKYRADGVLYVADFNLNFKERWVRRLVKSLAPAYKHTWKVMPAGGTHGHRVIDASLIRGNWDGRARLLVGDESSDHCPYIEWLTWNPVKRKR